MTIGCAQYLLKGGRQVVHPVHAEAGNDNVKHGILERKELFIGNNTEVAVACIDIEAIQKSYRSTTRPKIKQQENCT